MKRLLLCIMVFCLSLSLTSPAMLKAASVNAKSTTAAKSLNTSTKSTTPSPADKASAVKAKALAKLQPDLIISRVWADNDCLLNVEIRNAGKGTISTASHKNGQLALTIGKKTTRFYFTRPASKGPAVDPHGKLKRPGTTLRFNTRVALVKSAKVRVMVDAAKAIAESNEKNNFASTLLTGEKCKAQGTKKMRRSHAAGSDAKAHTRTSRMTQTTVRAPASLASIIAEHGVDFNTRPMSLNGGISIRSINDVTSYSFTLRYSVDRSLENGDITFYMMRGSETVAQATHAFAHGGGDPSVRVFMGQNFSWSLPVDLVNDDNYGIIAIKSDGLGISDPFTVNFPYRHHATGMGMSIEFTYPTTTFFRNGQEIRFRVASTCGRSVDDVHLQLVDSGSGSVAHDFGVLETGGPFTSSEHSWTIPADIAPGDYRLLARAGVSLCDGYEAQSAFSSVFSINPPLEEPDPSERNILSIRSPSGGDTIYTGTINQLWVQWRCDSCEDPDDLSYTRILMKNGTELQRIGPTHAGGDMNPMKWFDIFGYLSGSDYQVRIELNRYNYDTESPEMIRSETTGNFTIVNNTMSYHEDTIPLRLRTPSGFGGASFAIGSTLEIMWSHAPARSTDHFVRLTLTRDSTEGGGEWPIEASIPAYPSTYEWVIPDDVPPGAGYRVLIERVDGAGSSNSYLPFTITP